MESSDTMIVLLDSHQRQVEPGLSVTLSLHSSFKDLELNNLASGHFHSTAGHILNSRLNGHFSPHDCLESSVDVRLATQVKKEATMSNSSSTNSSGGGARTIGGPPVC